MVLTEAEFQNILANNPGIKVRKSKTKSMTNDNANLDSILSQAANKSSKYWNLKVYVQQLGLSVKKSDPSLGRVIEIFDSIKEYKRYSDLLLLSKKGIITSLERQTPLTIQEAFTRSDGEKISPIIYKADFIYKDTTGCTIVEDVKGFDESRQKYRTTKDFDLKWKLLKCRYPDLKFVLY